MNNKLLLGGIFCDLEKVFDCVNHRILLSQLEFYGITGKHYELYKSYLTNRYQRTLLQNGNDVTSTWAKVKHGVPQGSVLGPLHFLIFLNNLPMFVRGKSTPILFADDTSIFTVPLNNNINTVFRF